ncbi:hypothetical protein ACFVXC_29050 [Streptomyces sp. NPDC058257]|uniref:hypothetical protein n=1 Tax=Streptomyces sp. NPDC058257 TaxID=3346409 RepID=UPI0036E8EDF6
MSGVSTHYGVASWMPCSSAVEHRYPGLRRPLAGLVIGCTFATLRTTGGDLAPDGRVTETMSWLSSLDMVGGALGAAVFARLAVAEGSSTALLLVSAVTLLTSVIGCNTRTRRP